jgi:hypothetical protein
VTSSRHLDILRSVNPSLTTLLCLAAVWLALPPDSAAFSRHAPPVEAVAVSSALPDSPSPLSAYPGGSVVVLLDTPAGRLLAICRNNPVDRTDPTGRMTEGELLQWRESRVRDVTKLIDGMKDGRRKGALREILDAELAVIDRQLAGIRGGAEGIGVPVVEFDTRIAAHKEAYDVAMPEHPVEAMAKEHWLTCALVGCGGEFAGAAAELVAAIRVSGGLLMGFRAAMPETVARLMAAMGGSSASQVGREGLRSCQGCPYQYAQCGGTKGLSHTCAVAAPKAPREGRYEFPDQTDQGLPYVGQSGNMSKRLAQHENAGRLIPGTEATTEVTGGKTAREIAEHKRIQELTGGIPASQSSRVANKVDPIGPRRRHLLGR